MRNAALIVFGVAFLLYANTLGHGYVQDDAIVITDNFLTQQGFEGIPGLLTEDTFYGFFKTEGKSRLVAGGRYRPLTPVMFAIEYELFGMKPWVGHLVNVLFYGLTGVIVLFLLTWMGRNSPWARNALYFGLLGALLYVVHPIHTEVVANIKGRDEMMSFLLSVAALYLTVRKMPSKVPGAVDHLLAALLFLLALLSKENAITFLVIVPLTIWFFGGKKAKTALVATVPYVLASGLFLFLRGQVIGWEIGDPPRELLNNPFLKIVDNTYVDFTFGEKMSTIMFILGKYVQLLFVPFQQTHDYYPRHIDLMRWTDWQVILSACAYAAMIVVAILGLRKKRIYSYGILFYLITLSIVSNIVFPVGTNMSERFLYMPSLGWAIAVAGIAGMWNEKIWKRVVPVIAIVLLALSVLTVMRNRVWKSNYTLFLTDVKTAPNSAKLLAAAGGELMARKEDVPEGPLRQQRIRQALDYLIRAQEIHPNYKMSYLLRGNAHYYLQEWDQAIAAYQRVLMWEPGNQEAVNNLGIAYRDAGRYYGEKEGDLNKAIAYLNEAIRYLPNDYEVLHSLGVAYGLGGQPEKAVEYFKRGVEIAPENATAHFNLGLAYQRIGDLANAQKHRDIAVQLDPDILQRNANRQNQ